MKCTRLPKNLIFLTAVAALILGGAASNSAQAQISSTYENTYSPFTVSINTKQTSSILRTLIGEIAINRVVPVTGVNCHSSANCTAMVLGFFVTNTLVNSSGSVLPKSQTSGFQIANMIIEAEYYIDNVFQELVEVNYSTTDRNGLIYGQTKIRVPRNLNMGVHKIKLYASSKTTNPNNISTIYWRNISKVDPRLGFTVLTSTARGFLYNPSYDFSYPLTYSAATGKITLPMVVDKRFNLQRTATEALSGTEVSRWELMYLRRVYPYIWDNPYNTLEYYTYPGTLADNTIKQFPVLSDSPGGARGHLSISVPGTRANYLAWVRAYDWSGVQSFNVSVRFKVNVIEAPAYIEGSFQNVSESCVSGHTFRFAVKRPLKYFDQAKTTLPDSDLWGYLVYISSTGNQMPSDFGGWGYKVPKSSIVANSGTDIITIQRSNLFLTPGTYTLNVCALGTDGEEGHCSKVQIPVGVYCPTDGGEGSL